MLLLTHAATEEVIETIGAIEQAPTKLDNILTLALVAVLALVVIIAVIRKAVANAKANEETVVEEAPAPVAEAPVAPGSAGGVLSNLLSQLKQMNALDKFDEALAETPKVRADMGYPPLVTPTSQMVGVQAVTNVLQGERYKKVSKEIKAYCRGEYGRTPAPINPEIQKMILGDEKPIEGRYADSLAPIVEPTREKLGDLAKCDEDVLSYIAFPNLAEKFFEERKAKEENICTYSIVEA